ncbi:hypothetical protein IQ03_01948 [Gemmobacter caeni]|uniref:Uncharacterized protein n=1 Tax=Gemmobacter caeni TaxID=589035 RepID=A0A2T6B594_9RHOB|nr:hypothetical protein [Gemmobacter caeni]PTX51230.1 hypothetical protein C8N34_104351 [Gemmobacter caeni]TWJ01230.1 hypothetical protein IQ03_01948 [Gemmobacter caeni]
MPFKPITITGMDTNRTERDPRPGSALYKVVLILSGTPSASWARDFDTAWKQHIYMKKRDATVSGARIVITCSLDDWETVHVPELKDVMAQVNSREEAAEKAREAEASRRKEEAASDKRKIEQAANRFKKDN